MQLHELRSAKGARTYSKRLGRGNGSGKGTYSGKGQKGQKSRSGGNIKPGFEGGQTPLIRRMPKLKGFKTPIDHTCTVVNLDTLNEKFEDGDTVSAKTLVAKGLCRAQMPVKILGNGDCQKKLTISVDKLSKSAEEKLKKAGCTITLVQKPGKKEAVKK